MSIAALPDEPSIIQDIRDGMSLHDNPNLTLDDGKTIIAYIDALLDRSTALSEEVGRLRANPVMQQAMGACGCDQFSDKCKLGRTRAPMTTGYAGCWVPLPNTFTIGR